MRIAYCSDSVPPIAHGVTRTLCKVVDALRGSATDFLFVSAVEPDPALEWRDRVRLIPRMRMPLYP